MIRQILCRTCGDMPVLTESDRAQGWEYRRVFISCEVPPNHGIAVNGFFEPVDEIKCDSCGAVITGQIAVARTQWRGGPAPGCWESTYGKILPQEAVNLHDKLTK